MPRTLSIHGTLALLVSLPGIAGAQDALVDAPLPHVSGQSVSAAFEGWYPNADGTLSLVFGYFNRNYEERLDIPVGPSNRFEPGPADRGQRSYDEMYHAHVNMTYLTDEDYEQTIADRRARRAGND